ncbi:MAG: ABC transporter ATP-binding protein [Reichenbachiella sp.]|uniref:ABC transporter ATP-binding protein n=1 Tax=Reichenbachiella sp. TaxID=2184521 RepID=UPI003267C61B
MIQIENIKKRFDRLQVLDGVSLTINRPGIFAILGPNGSGKTTLLKSILGMVLPQSGNIQLNGESTLKEWKYRNQIGYLPQIARFPDNLSVREVIEMIKTIRSQPANEQPLIERFSLQDFLDKKLGNLSGGTRQKVNIVLTFMFDCELYILDEPTAGLDPVALIQLKDLIGAEKEKGKTFMITTHIMNLVEELSDEIVFLLDGKIYFKGSLEELKQKTGQQDLEHAIAQILQ